MLYVFFNVISLILLPLSRAHLCGVLNPELYVICIFLCIYISLPVLSFIKLVNS